LETTANFLNQQAALRRNYTIGLGLEFILAKISRGIFIARAILVCATQPKLKFLRSVHLAQATNPNEPMLGALWSSPGITFAIVSLRNHRVRPLVVSGLHAPNSLAPAREITPVRQKSSET
jgi:hypothetical protein